MNIGAPWPDLEEAEPRVREMQSKLHQWAVADPGRRVHTQPQEYGESRMRREPHVRFGGRAAETHPSKDGQGPAPQGFLGHIRGSIWT